MYPGWTFDTIDDMSFEQIESAMTKGRPRETNAVPVESMEDVWWVQANIRKVYGF